MADPVPLSGLADLMPIVSAPWVLHEQVEYSGAGSGDILAARLAPSRWGAKVALAPMVHTRARALQAKIEALDGALSNFYFYSPANCYPASDAGGIKLGTAKPKVLVVGANNKSLSLQDLPAGYRLNAGDMVEISYGTGLSRRYLGRLVSDADPVATGRTTMFEVRPHLPVGITTGLAVNLKKPAAKVFIVPNTFDVSHSGRFSQMSFEVMQRP